MNENRQNDRVMRANREMLRRAIGGLSATSVFSRQCAMSAAISDFAWDAGTGYYSSGDIERVITSHADSFGVEDDVPPEPGTVLMVMTSAEKIGGHTRVVERWIEQDPSRKYSVVLTNQQQDDHVPRRLVDAVGKSGGRLIKLDVGKDRLGRARDLRTVALGFEKVVLHIDMDDLLPLLAFGTEKFQRPVGLFNHADHVFWLGVSIADRVAEIRRFGDELSRTKRGVTASTIVGIPADVRTVEVLGGPQVDIRARHGIPAQSPLIVTCGRANKYEPVLGLDLLPAVRSVLERVNDACFLAIGFALGDFPAWQRASLELGGRILAIGSVPNDELVHYFRAADVVFDSYPMAGATALADALVCKCPILSVIGPVGHADWVYDCHGCCYAAEELIEKAVRLLGDAALRKRWAEEDLSTYSASASKARFLERLDEFFNKLVLPHRVQRFFSQCEPITDLDRYHLAMSTSREDAVRLLNGRFVIYRETGSYGIRKVLEILGHRLVLKWRRSPFAREFPEFFVKKGLDHDKVS